MEVVQIPVARKNFHAPKRKRHLAWWRFLFKLAKTGLDGLFGQPVRQMEIFFDFTALVTMFERFFGLIIGFSEGMFGVPHCLVYDFQGLGHIARILSRE
jgi:hypothetical protein